MNERLNRPGDLRSFIRAARSAAEVDNWFAAMALALTLPDICGAVDDPGIGKSAKRYAAWWDTYMLSHFIVTPDELGKEPYSLLSGKDAFALRCSYLHSGTDDIGGVRFQRVRFLGPPTAWPYGQDPEGAVLYISMEHFVEWICIGIEQWLADRRDSPTAQQRLAGLVSIVPAAIRVAGRPNQP